MGKTGVMVLLAMVSVETIVRTVTTTATTARARHESSQGRAPPRPEEDTKCLECACTAMGNGSCAPGGGNPTWNSWGPFHITQAYWVDAGQPVQPGDSATLPGAFERCVMEPFCAVRTVKGYMSGPSGMKDCDRDGKLTCKDLILNHIKGRYVCEEIEDKRVKDVEECMKKKQLG